jgi:hypothetical protein
MGLFKRQRSPSPQAQEAGATVVVGDEDLIACASVLGKMEEAMLGGSDADIRISAQGIAWAGGIRPSGDLMHWVPTTSPVRRTRWPWAALCARWAHSTRTTSL